MAIMIRRGLFLAGLWVVASVRTLLLVQSPSTPSELLHLTQGNNSLLWLPPSCQLSHTAASDFIQLERLVLDSTGVIDVTFSSVAEAMIAGLCEVSQTPHIVLGYGTDFDTHNWTYYLSARKRDLARALDAVVTYFGWEDVNVCMTQNSHLAGISTILEQQINHTYAVQDFTLNTAGYIESMVGRSMRLSGNRVSVLLTDPNTTRAIVTAQYQKSIGGEGFGNVMPLYSSLYTLDPQVPSHLTGNLVLVERGLEDVNSISELYTHWLFSAAQLLVNSTQLEGRPLLQPRYSLVNLQAGIRVIVGSVQGDTVTLSSAVIFLGNTTVVPINAALPLPISGSFGVNDDGYIFPYIEFYYYGSMLAVDQVNSWPNVLKHFHLELFNFTTGVSVWDYNFAYEHVYPVRNKLGLAVLCGSTSGVLIELMDMLNSFGYVGPVVGSMNTADVLSDRVEFPRFIRTMVEDRYMIVVYLEMFKRFGWKHCGLLYSNDSWSLGFSSEFSAQAKQQGISIVNKEELRLLPSDIPTIDTLRNYTANFLDLIDSHARVLLIFVSTNPILVVDYLYELGLRGGDVQFVAMELLPGYFTTNDTESNLRRSELMRGAIDFAPVSFVGAFGAQVADAYWAKYNNQPPAYACIFYDSALAVAYALDIVINNGEDYNNPAVLMKALRNSRFVGCSGTVTFDRETNDRSLMSYNILNAQFAENDRIVTNITIVAEYDPTSSVLFRSYSDLIWCDGTTNVPLDMRNSTIGCLHEDRFDKAFAKGEYLLWSICAILALLTTLFAAFLWKVKWNRPLQPLQALREMQVSDVIMMLGIAVEMLQYLSIGPDISFLSKNIMKYVYITTLDLKNIDDYGSDSFQLLWAAVIGCVGLSVLMCLLVFSNIDYVLERVPCARTIGDLSEAALYFIGTWLFIPIVSVLLEVFICVRGVGLDQDSLTFTDSYLHADCYVMCWQDKHLVYVVLTSVILLIYVPAAVTLRPFWQEIQSLLNIKALPAFLLLKSALQVYLVILSKTAKKTNQLAHFCVFVGCIGAFLAFSLWIQCYNYKRTQLWHILSLVSVLWAATISAIHILTDIDQHIILVPLLVSGWCTIALLGFLYQFLRIPSLLYRKKGVDTRPLFRFAFKRTTLHILAELSHSYQQVNHPCRVLYTPSPAARRYEVTSELHSDAQHQYIN